MNAGLNQTMLDNDWSSLCRRDELHLAQMSGRWSAEARDLVQAKLRKFVSQPGPRSEKEVCRRREQSWGLGSIIRSVAHIERTLGQYPRRDVDRLRLVRVVCDVKLPTNEAEKNALRAATTAVDAQLRSMAFDEIAFASRR